MELKVSEAIATVMALDELKQQTFPIALSMKIAKNVKQLEELRDLFLNEEQKLLKLHEAEPMEGNPNAMTIKKDPEKFNTARQSLLAELVEVDLVMIKSEDFGDVELKPSTVMAASLFIE